MWDERPAWLERHGKTMTSAILLMCIVTALACRVAGDPVAAALLYAGSVSLSILALTVAANVLVLAAVMLPARLLAHLVRRARRS